MSSQVGCNLINEGTDAVVPSTPGDATGYERHGQNRQPMKLGWLRRCLGLLKPAYL